MQPLSLPGLLHRLTQSTLFQLARHIQDSKSELPLVLAMPRTSQKTALAGIADLHPLACLQMVSADIQQPEGYPDAMPLEVALAQPDHDKFIGAMEKELKQHSELKHWRIVHNSQVPRNAKPIPMVWTLHRKRDPAGGILKWKARLCAGGHCQVYGNTYWSTFAPVVSWTTVHCIFVLALLLGWHM